MSRPSRREPLLGDLDVDLFVLHAEQLHLVHVRDTQQLLAHIIGEHLDLGIREAVRLQRIDHAVHVAELVIEERSAQPRR
jgi:predicted nucleotidyltransferase